MYIRIELDGKGLDPIDVEEKVKNYGITIAQIGDKVFMYGDHFSAADIAQILSVTGEYYYCSINVGQDRGGGVSEQTQKE